MDQEVRRDGEAAVNQPAAAESANAEAVALTAQSTTEQEPSGGRDALEAQNVGDIAAPEFPEADEAAPELWQEPESLRERLERERRALEAERSAFEREKLESRVARALEQRGLGGEFAAYLTGADEAESLKRVEQFEGMFRRRLRAELEKRLGGSPAPREPRRARGFTREALRRMSPGEINRNWEAISRTLEG